MVEVLKSYCRNCPAGCGIELEVEQNRITYLQGDKSNPNSKGYFCPKGLASMDLHNGHDRLTSTKLRMKGGQFIDISSESALDDIAAKLAALIDVHGPRSVALYKGTGSYFNLLTLVSMTAWRHALGSPNYFSSSTLDQSAKSVTAGRLGAFATGKRVILDVDAMLLAGVNPIVSHSGYPGSPLPSTNPTVWLRSAKARGMKLIVVDPRMTETARLADVHLALKPGEDVSLFAGLIHLLLRNGGTDKAFCSRFVTSLDALAESVQHFTPDYVAERAGITVAQLEAAARILCDAQRPSVTSGTGPDMSRRSNLSEHLIEALNAICGGYVRAGEAAHNVGLLYRTRPIMEGVHPPGRSWETGPKCRSEDAGLVADEFPTALLPQEILAPGKDKIRALIVVGGNPATALGQPELTAEAFKDLELLVTMDMRWTETTKLSTHVIAVKAPYECHDLTGFLDNFFIKPFAQYSKPAIEAPPGVIEDWEVFWGLAKRLGKRLVIKPPSLFMPYTAIAKALELDMESKPASLDIIRWLGNQGTYDFNEIASHPSGFAPDERPTSISPAEEDDGARLDVCPLDVADELAAARREQSDQPQLYRLAVRRLLHTMNSAYTNADRTRKKYPVNFAFMNPQDMRVEAFAEGDSIEIESPSGRVIAIVKEDVTMREGVVSVPHQWGKIDLNDDPTFRFGAHVGHLVSLTDERQTINYMPMQSGISIDVRATASKHGKM